MTVCEQCSTKLYTQGMPSGATFRCAVCAQITVPDDPAAHSANSRRACWSLALGLSSMILLIAAPICFLMFSPVVGLVLCILPLLMGVPAVYYGVRSLLRMRYEKTSKRIRIAATIGTGSGAFFGVVIGGFTALVAAFGLLVTLTNEQTRGVEETTEIYQNIATVSVPDHVDLQPHRANTSMFVNNIRLRDHESSQETRIWMNIYRFPRWVTTNRSQFNSILEGDIYELSGVDEQERGVIKWEILGKESSIYRVQWMRPADQDKGAKATDVVQYYTLVDQEPYTYGIALFHDPNRSGLTESHIRAMFESLRPANP